MVAVAGSVSRKRISAWLGVALLALSLVFLARARPDWPWFSLWLFGLLVGLAVLSVPAVRRALGLTRFRVTLATLAGVALFNLFLFHVETHRQRSERLEIEGVWFDANQARIRVGVGGTDLDVRLEGSLYDFDRWSLDLRPIGADRFAVEQVRDVDLLRVRRATSGWWAGSNNQVVLGRPLRAGTTVVDASNGSVGSADSLWLEAPRSRTGSRLHWGEATAPLSLLDPLLDRRLASQLRSGIPVAELAWDSLPDRARAEDLVLTRTRSERRVGRLRVVLPRYTVVSRSEGESWLGQEPIILSAGDTLSITSRGKRWAVAVGRVAGVSRVAAPTAVWFVQRPRSQGWALPSAEACGRDADRCAMVSTRTLPAPQAHFDLGGFGLDTTRYSVLARLETDPDEVRLVGARESESFAYGEVRPYMARAIDPDAPPAGLLLRVHRAAQGRRSAVALTVGALFLLMLGALLVASGDARVWRFSSSGSAHAVAAWSLLNVFLVFLGVRLALGLRVAYTPPFYDRAATTAVGLWITFSLLIVALARWPAWSPGFWRWIGRMERPLSRLFLPGLARADEPTPSTRFTLASDHEPMSDDPARSSRARGRTVAGLALWLPSLAALLWQRPDAAAGLVVAGAALSGWLAMGVARRRGAHWPLSPYPLRVLIADAEVDNPSVTFAAAAAASIVLVLAMHAPLLALAPVAALLLLFGVDGVARLATGWRAPARRGWLLLGVVTVLALAGVLLFVGPILQASLGIAAAFVALAVWLGRPQGSEGERRIVAVHRGFDQLRIGVLSGVGWVGVIVLLGALVFLNTQEIPPFVRFALVFTLFLLAIRAGLACNRVLRQGTRRGRIEALALLVIPVGVLLVFMLFDFGLGLVFFVPMFITVLLSARIDRLPASLMVGATAVVAIIALAAGSVLRPSLEGVRSATDVGEFDAEFRVVGNPLVDGLRNAGLAGPITRATVRSIAASDPQLLEDALAFAGPSEALLASAASLEQVWGGRAYAASGWTGTGFAGTLLFGRGIPTAVSYAENTFSVYVLSEHGALGGLAVLLTYLALLAIVGLWIVRVHATVQETPLGLAVLALTVGGVLWLTVPAAYVAASNLAVVPLTGQNMPFLGLNSWADVVLVSGLATGILSGLVALDRSADPEARS